MPSNLSIAAKRLGISGIAFLAVFVLFLIFYFAGKGGLAFLSALILLPLACILLFRGFRHLRRNGLWSVRNRLLAVYMLIGVLPLCLIIVLIGLGAWALTTELAIYLANSALKSRLMTVEYCVQAIRNLPENEQASAVPDVMKNFASVPGLRVYLKDAEGEHRFPASAPPLAIPSGWKNVHGLLVLDGRFWGWAHYLGDGEEITAVAPLSDETIANLVPNLGAISLFEDPKDKHTHGHPASAGSLRTSVRDVGTPKNPDFKFDMTVDGKPAERSNGVHLPPPAFRFDIPVWWLATESHYHLDAPNKTFGGVIWVYSRPSAVLSSFFSGTEALRGILFDAFIAVAILFLLVELAATIVGARLARRITGSIKSLYEGTRRVISGDFGHRIPVRSNDQLGELATSFNQMTGNLERLLSVEKEKERLQTELEIAREVQGQLYPKQAPPTCGLQLTVQCDPARMVSGDYYDYQELEGKRLAFAIGDVAGKGISAALLMATLQSALRAQMTQYQPLRETDCDHVREIDVAQLVASLNRQLFAHTAPEKYATFFFALFDENNRTLTYTNAGHLSPLLFRNGDIQTLDTTGTVVGAFPFSKYEESCLVMKPGDLLVCYTDGITEPENAYGEEFGEERLIDLVRKHSHRGDDEIIRIVLEAVRSWTASPELHDDMTLLLAREVQPQ